MTFQANLKNARIAEGNREEKTKMKNRVIALILAIFLILSLTACGGDSEELPQRDRSEQANNHEGSASDETPTPVIPFEAIDVPNDLNGIQNDTSRNLSTKNIDGWDFSDGVAWVRNNVWQLIDTSGQVLFSLGTDDLPISDFSNGVALVARSASTAFGNSGRELIDKNGNIISSPELGGYDEICALVPELGMAIVYKRVVTFEATEDQFGIIDSKGDWVLRLTNNNALFNAIQNSTYGRNNFNIQDYFRYLGEGIIIYKGFKSHHLNTMGAVDIYIYNISTNESFVVANIPNNGSIISNIENGYGLINAGSVSFGEPGVRICSIKSNGQMNELFSFSIGQTIDYPHFGDYSEGLFFYNNYSNHYTQGFYDINGNLIIDLSEYIIEFNDVRDIKFEYGYCLLNLLNPQGDRFYTIVDIKGNLTFEPKSRESWGNSVSQVGNGLFALRQNDQLLLINALGETMVDLGNAESVSNFNEGVALVKTSNGVYYIEEPHNIPRLEPHQTIEGITPILDNQPRKIYFYDTYNQFEFNPSIMFADKDWWWGGWFYQHDLIKEPDGWYSFEMPADKIEESYNMIIFYNGLLDSDPNCIQWVWHHEC